MEKKRYCFALDLIDDPKRIQDYEEYHKKVWPEIESQILKTGVTSLEIYRVANRLFMILDAPPHFSLESKAKLDAENPKVQEWETLMWTYQQPLPFAKPNEKWVLMTKIYSLSND
jgi:L-rhamnose mutarotase